MATLKPWKGSAEEGDSDGGSAGAAGAAGAAVASSLLPSDSARAASLIINNG